VRVAERYSRIRERRIRNRKKMWKIGIGTGAATIAGAAAIWYVSKKDKK
jgi:precorrin-6B methylase 2